MRSALVLNATFEPLSVVPARRAACLILADKADLIEDDGTHIHSENLALPNPLVIRVASRRVRARRASLSVLRRSCRLDRPCDATLTRWAERMGERGSCLPALQSAQAGPDA
jgi:hypothetical protein